MILNAEFSLSLDKKFFNFYCYAFSKNPQLYIQLDGDGYENVLACFGRYGWIITSSHPTLLGVNSHLHKQIPGIHQANKELDEILGALKLIRHINYKLDFEDSNESSL